MIFIYLQPSFTTWKVYWPAPRWLVGSVGRALQRYRKGHGFKSRTDLNFFQAIFHWVPFYNCEDRSILNSSPTAVHIYDFHIFTASINPLRCFISGKKKKKGFFRSRQIKESLCLWVSLWMIKICDFLSPFSISIGWQVISNYFLWLFFTIHPQSGPTWASIFSPQACTILPIYRWSGFYLCF